MNLKKGVGEKIIKMHNIYPCITNFNLAKTFKLGTLPVVVLSRPPKLIHISLKHSLLFAAQIILLISIQELCLWWSGLDRRVAPRARCECSGPSSRCWSSAGSIPTAELLQCCCCLPCNHCTWVVEEILDFGTRLRSTHGREFNYLKLCRPARTTRF